MKKILSIAGVVLLLIVVAIITLVLVDIYVPRLVTGVNLMEMKELSVKELDIKYKLGEYTDVDENIDMYTIEENQKKWIKVTRITDDANIVFFKMDYQCSEDTYQDRKLLSFAGLPRYSLIKLDYEEKLETGGLRIYKHINGDYISVTCIESIQVSILSYDEIHELGY